MLQHFGHHTFVLGCVFQFFWFALCSLACVIQSFSFVGEKEIMKHELRSRGWEI